MKVLHVIPSLAAAHGGPTRAIELMERALVQQGIVVETATTDDDGLGHHNGKPCGHPLNENCVTRRYFPIRLNFYKIAPGFAYWLFRHVRDYDLLHVHALFSFTSVIAAVSARLAGIPYIVRPLGTLGTYGIAVRHPWLKRISLSLIEGPILRHATFVHFTSEAERTQAAELGLQMQSVVIPIGVEQSHESDSSAMVARVQLMAGSRCILFLSRLDLKKNVEGLLHAFAICRRDLSDIRLVIAGDGRADYVAKLKALAARLGLENEVTWTGHLDEVAKISAFASAQVFVLPSLSENFGIAVVEAMLAGLPCVLGSGVAIAQEVAQANAGLVVEPDPESIAHGLTRIMSDGPLRAEMARNATALACEKFSASAMGTSLADLYARIASARTTRVAVASVGE